MRRIWKHPGLLALMIGGLSLAACEGGYAYYAPVAPPPPRVETFGVAPGPGYVWINGYWNYRSGGYTWIPGRWARTPRGRHWEEGRWEHHGNGWTYHQGHWR